MRVARLLLAAALVVSAVVVRSELAEGAPAGHGAGTDVRFEDDTIVFTLHLQVLYRSRTSRDALEAGLTAAADYWNRGLARYAYSGCFNVRFEIDAEYVQAINRNFESTDYTIRTYGSSHVGEMADGRGLPSVFDRFAEPDLPATEDYTGPFEHPVEAYWPPWLFEDTAALAHEMGHLFGLGDDYARDENGDTSPLEGREGTLMDSGDAIDQVLADRIGSGALLSGYEGEFPECWTGTLVGTGVNHPATPCEPAATYDYTIKIVVTPEGLATLSGHGITGSSCAAITTENDLALTGTKTPDGFSFPGTTFPGPMTVRTTGSSATGRGRGFVQAFEYNVTVELQQQFGPPAA